MRWLAGILLSLAVCMSAASLYVSLTHAGPAGPSGTQGDAGIQGPAGPPGTAGSSGQTAYSSYNLVCNQPVVNSNTGVTQTFYYPCTNSAAPQPGA
jgi:hypothetical protein